MGDEDPTVIAFPKDPDAVEISIGQWRPRERGACRHWRVELREEQGDSSSGFLRHRLAECRDCKEALDPMEVLWRYAAADDKLRRQDEAWADLDEAWSWLWENGATLAISRAGGVRGAITINSKRRTRKPSPCDRDGLPSMIVRLVEDLKNLKRWS